MVNIKQRLDEISLILASKYMERFVIIIIMFVNPCGGNYYTFKFNMRLYI